MINARNSFGPDYACKYAWDCFVQCGEKGVVFSQKGNYTTSFFEAFPKNPSCFIRGEGTNIEEAEKDAWYKYLKILSCDHEMERRNRKDGYGYCKHCSYSSMVFEPLTKCCKCKKPTRFTSDIKNNFYCKKHSITIPVKLRNMFFDTNKRFRKSRKIKKQIKKGSF